MPGPSWRVQYPICTGRARSVASQNLRAFIPNSVDVATMRRPPTMLAWTEWVPLTSAFGRGPDDAEDPHAGGGLWGEEHPILPRDAGREDHVGVLAAHPRRRAGGVVEGPTADLPRFGRVAHVDEVDVVVRRDQRGQVV